MSFFSQNGDDYCENCGKCIRGDGEKLCGSGFVTQRSDNGGQEKGESVEGQRHCVEAETIKPAFVISKGGADISPGEGLGIGCICRRFETRMDEGAFGFSEKRGGRGIVVDEEIGAEGDDDSKQSFLYIALAQYTPNQAMIYLTIMKIHLHPFSPPTPSINPMPYAKMPPKAPANEAAEKNRETR